MYRHYIRWGLILINCQSKSSLPNYLIICWHIIKIFDTYNNYPKITYTIKYDWWIDNIQYCFINNVSK